MVEQLRVGCVQFAPRFGDIAHNLAETEHWIIRAAGQGAGLIVLPELANTGYAFRSREELGDLAEPAAEGPTVQAWRRLAGSLGIHLIAGFAERWKDCVYNASALISPDGTVQIYRKLHLSDFEKHLFSAGQDPVRVYQTDIGRISMLICYDVWFPEVVRTCALAGAEMIALPTNWTGLKGEAGEQVSTGPMLARANAHCNRVFFLCANRIGSERGLRFVGQSLIVSPSGQSLALLGENETGVAYANILPSDARNKLISTDNSVLADRRPAFYHESDRWSSE